jgi:hypothetical protein
MLRVADVQASRLPTVQEYVSYALHTRICTRGDSYACPRTKKIDLDPSCLDLLIVHLISDR